MVVERSTPQWLLGLFPGFVADWRDNVYAEPEFALLRQGMRLEIDESSWHVDASVSHRRGRLGIGVRYLPHYRVTAGAILGMHDLFMSLCSRRDFYSEVPGANEGPLTHPHHKRFRDYTELRRGGGPPIVHTLPSDETRYMLALLMMTAAFHWLLYHEESHFLAGHLLFAEQVHAQESVNEVEDGSQCEEHAADLRALESHADERAHLQVVRAYATMPNILEHPVEERRTPAEGVRLAVVTIGSVLMLFEANRTGRPANHPMPLTRLLDAFGVVFTTLAQREASIYGPDCNEWIDDATMQWVMDRAMEDLQAAATLLGLSGKVSDALRPLFEAGVASSGYTEQLLAVKKRLARMRPVLAEFQERIVRRTLPEARIDKW
jgi:hypothetical protein